MTTILHDWNERRRFNAQLHEVEKAPLDERKEHAAEWLDALQNSPKIVAERIGWLLDGSYGYGSYQAAREVITRKRMNQTAWLGQTIAALEWQCPNDRARAAWHKLTPTQQDHLNQLIRAEIASALEQE